MKLLEAAKPVFAPAAREEQPDDELVDVGEGCALIVTNFEVQFLWTLAMDRTTSVGCLYRAVCRGAGRRRGWDAMVLRVSQWLCVCPFFLFLGACESKTPSQPSGVTGSVAGPRQQQPANGAQIRNVDQPVMPSVANALVTQPSTTTYTFQVATDTGFANKVQTRSGIAEGSGGHTSVRLDALAPGLDYYWHAQATGAGTVGVFGQTYKFTIGPAEC